MGHFIDLETWPRRAIHDFFLGFEDPWFNLTAEVEVGPTWSWCKDTGASFSLACWYAVLHAANEVPALRMRLRPEGVWVHERVRVGATVLKPDNCFTYVYFPHGGSFAAFAAGAEAAMATRLQEDGLEPASGEDDLLYGTVLPWVRFTGMKHARAGGVDESVPKIALGKATAVGEGRRMPVNVEGHHALLDGIHVGAFFAALEAALCDPDGTLGGSTRGGV
jgi:chloramphenicol O-acetyltransferase type A